MSADLRERFADLAARLTRWAYAPYPPLGADGRDPYRWCIYCGCDCYEDEPEHRPTCPLIVGLHQVTHRELGMRGPRDPYAFGMLCMDCGTPFKIGDFYAHRETDENVREVVCVGCRVLNPEATDAV